MSVQVGRKKFTPVVEMSGARLEIVQSFRYLGVYLDSALSWRDHFRYLEVKLHKIYGTFARLSRNTFGLRANVCIEVYKSAIEPAMLYGFPVWGPVCKYKWATKQLTKIQRSFLLRSCKAYRTVSADALCVVANVKPIHLQIEELLQIHEVKSCGQLEVEEGIVQIQIPQNRSVHPASNKVDAQVDIDGSLSSSLVVGDVFYTDGSGSVNSIGSAYVVYRNSEEVHHEGFKLPSYCSVFQAELYAIFQALKYAHPSTSVLIYSDSRASLQAIADSNSDNNLVLQIQEELKKFNVFPQLSWVKAHVGIIGNERADELAKEAAISGELINLEAPMSFAKRYIKASTTELWNDHWINSDNGGCTRIFFPTITHRKLAKFLEPNFIITQFLTGHGKFAAYLSRFRIWRSGACECGALQEPHHLIRACPATASLRASSPNINLNSPFQSFSDFQIFSDYLNGIHKLLLFWESHR